MIKKIDTGFDGLLLLEPKTFKDARGFFYESWKNGDYKEAGIEELLLQDNVSISHKNVIRGLHIQKNQGQLVTVISGKIYDVVVDVRPESKTFKQFFSIELDADNPQQLYMQPGFAHGFCVLSDKAIVHYKCTQYYSAQDEGGILWNDPELGINWPGENFIISERDSNFHGLSG
jgi:dTDP-4-dehydrorhamnose 3,5-epimerase